MGRGEARGQRGVGEIAAVRAAGDRSAAGKSLEQARKKGLGKIRLVSVEAERLKLVEEALGQTAAVTSTGRE